MAARATATATCSALVLAVAVALAGCGGGGSTPGRSEAFAWLQPASAPSGWSSLRVPSASAMLAVPPGWQRITSDPGTVSAARVGRHGLIVGYLNATPRQANETLRNWAVFRPTHNAREGDRGVRVVGAVANRPFGAGRASCVDDTYRTSRSRYRELACLVAGPRGQSVVVAAATSAAWPRLAPALRSAVRAFRA
jgi:hypothetical protein